MDDNNDDKFIMIREDLLIGSMEIITHNNIAISEIINNILNCEVGNYSKLKKCITLLDENSSIIRDVSNNSLTCLSTTITVNNSKSGNKKEILQSAAAKRRRGRGFGVDAERRR